MNEGLEMKGKCTLRAFERGTLSSIMAQGWNLATAMSIAQRIGRKKFEITVENLIVTVGKELAASVLMGDIASTDLFQYFAIGSGDTSPALADISLTTEVTRKEILLSTRSGSTITLTVFFSASQCTFAIEEAGIFGEDATASAGSGTMFNHFLVEYDNSAGEYDLTFEYNLSV